MTYWRINSKKRRLFTILVFPFVLTYFSFFSPNYSINILILYFMMMGGYIWFLWGHGIIKEWTTGKHRSRYLHSLEEM